MDLAGFTTSYQLFTGGITALHIGDKLELNNLVYAARTGETYAGE
jgi:demethylmenaquinone methyltransferase/2-methoxy-6-polyprenyl-1,4-benzoquinol methylase